MQPPHSQTLIALYCPTLPQKPPCQSHLWKTEFGSSEVHSSEGRKHFVRLSLFLVLAFFFCQFFDSGFIVRLKESSRLTAGDKKPQRDGSGCVRTMEMRCAVSSFVTVLLLRNRSINYSWASLSAVHFSLSVRSVLTLRNRVSREF